MPINLSENNFESLFDFWLNQIKISIPKYSYNNYSSIIKNHLIPSLGNKKIAEINDSDIEVYIFEKLESGLSKDTLKKHYQILKQVLDQAVFLNLIKYNPAKFVHLPETKKERNRPLTKKEIQKLLNVAKDYDEWIHNFIVITLYLGMRRNESLGLSWNDIDFENKIIHIRQKLNYIPGKDINTKPLPNSSQRKITMSNKVIKTLKHMKNKQLNLEYLLKSKYNNKYNLVFCKDNGDIYHPNAVTRKFYQIVSIASLSSEITIHTLRKTYAALLLKNNVNMKTILDKLGVSNIDKSFIKTLVERS